jgi:hypothetical protein
LIGIILVRRSSPASSGVKFNAKNDFFVGFYVYIVLGARLEVSAGPFFSDNLPYISTNGPN